MNRFNLLILFALLLLFSSCLNKKNLLSYQELAVGNQEIETIQFEEITLQPGDVVSISVAGPDEETLKPFLVSDESVSGVNTLDAIQLSGYLIDKEGNVSFPLLGDVQIKNLTVKEAKERFEAELNEFLKDPVVNVRLLNFRITLQGEVNRPGNFTLFNERISIPDAIGFAGGLTPYANRENVLLVREENGTRFMTRLNLQDPQFFQSPYFYLKQNDMLYFEPRKYKKGDVVDQTSKVLPFLTAASAIAAIVVAVIR